MKKINAEPQKHRFILLLQLWQRDLIWLFYSHLEVIKPLGKSCRGKVPSLKNENDESNHFLSEDR